MKFFDLHCDTLYKAFTENGSIYDNNYNLSLKRGLKNSPWFQCFAIWIPDEYRGEKAVSLVNNSYNLLKKEIKNHEGVILQCKNKDDFLRTKEDNKCGVVFTIEGGGALGSNLDNLKIFKNLGVKMITLTWNGSCEIGDGSGVKNGKGLTKFGIDVIKEMNNLDIVIDLSHASDKLFYDVLNVSNKPVVATHSNSRKICNHRRNITDEQFKLIRECGGLVGLNFCKDFLSEHNPSKYDIIKHTEHFLSLGGEKTICIGSDFDGADFPDGITGIESIESLAENFLRCNYSENLVEDIFFNNAYKFFTVN